MILEKHTHRSIAKDVILNIIPSLYHGILDTNLVLRTPLPPVYKGFICGYYDLIHSCRDVHFGLRSKNYYSYLERKTFMLMLVLYLGENCGPKMRTKSVFIRKVDSLFGVLCIYCKERKSTLGLWFSASF